MSGNEILDSMASVHAKPTSNESSSAVPTKPKPSLERLRLSDSPSPAPHMVRGRDLFKSSILAHEADASFFYRFIACLRLKAKSRVEATDTHKFIADLAWRGRLVRCYTQNIDGLEEHVGLQIGIPTKSKMVTTGMASTKGQPQVVQLHGGVDSARCTVCAYVGRWQEEDAVAFEKGESSGCRECGVFNKQRQLEGKRVSRDSPLRPNIVLLDEVHPLGRKLFEVIDLDRRAKASVLLIMGTSLKIDACKALIENLGFGSRDSGRTVLYVNKEPPDQRWSGIIDTYFKVDCDAWVTTVQRAMGRMHGQDDRESSGRSSEKEEADDALTLFEADDGALWETAPLDMRTAEEDRAWLDVFFPGT